MSRQKGPANGNLTIAAPLVRVAALKRPPVAYGRLWG
jgi:hypothetical protein